MRRRGRGAEVKQEDEKIEVEWEKKARKTM